LGASPIASPGQADPSGRIFFTPLVAVMTKKPDAEKPGGDVAGRRRPDEAFMNGELTGADSWQYYS
jgi:hypothetical protein